MHGGFGSRIRPMRVAHVGQRHVAGSQIVHLAQYGERVVDLMASFDADQRGDFPRLVDPANVGGGIGDFENRRVFGGDALHQIDLFDGRLNGFGSLDVHRHPHRPELAADLPCAQARNVGHQRRCIRRLLGQR